MSFVLAASIASDQAEHPHLKSGLTSCTPGKTQLVNTKSGGTTSRAVGRGSLPCGIRSRTRSGTRLGLMSRSAESEATIPRDDALRRHGLRGRSASRPRFPRTAWEPEKNAVGQAPPYSAETKLW